MIYLPLSSDHTERWGGGGGGAVDGRVFSHSHKKVKIPELRLDILVNCVSKFPQPGKEIKLGPIVMPNFSPHGTNYQNITSHPIGVCTDRIQLLFYCGYTLS